MKTHIHILILALLMGITETFGQSAPLIHQPFPQEGDSIQNYVFNNVINHSKHIMSIDDFKGKWLVLDWWAPGCVGCIASFPKMNHLDQIFKDRVKIVMIGLQGKKKGTAIYGTKIFYDSQEKLHKLKMTAAFDSASFDIFSLRAVPLILVVNPNGIIVAKTLSLDSLQLDGFISGKKVPYVYAYSKNELNTNHDYNKNIPLLTSGRMSNGGIDTNFISRSILAHWDKRMPQASSYGFDEDNDKHRLLYKKRDGWASASGFDLQHLIQIAYTGKSMWGDNDSLYSKLSQPLILEVKDKSIFDEQDLATGANMYSYSLIYPGLTPSKARRILLEDLKRTFSFESSIEKRDVLVWKLTVVDASKASALKTKGGKNEYQSFGSYSGFKVTNWSLKDISKTELYEAIGIMENNFRYPIILVDQTGLNFNIDLNFKAKLSDLKDVRKELNKVGLDLVKEPFKMDCIVIKDDM